MSNYRIIEADSCATCKHCKAVSEVSGVCAVRWVHDHATMERIPAPVSMRGICSLHKEVGDGR